MNFPFLASIKSFRRRSRKGPTTTAGFSLIEIVIVIAVLSILAGMMVPMSVHLIDQRNVESTKKEMSEIKDGLLHYYEDVSPSAFPANLADLVTAPFGITGWNGPYFSGSASEVQTDAWGNNYTYRESGNYAIVISGGNDKSVDSGSYDNFPPSDSPADNSDLVVNVNGNLIADKLNEEKIEETKEILKLVAGDIYNTNPTTAPTSYTPSLSDAWGNTIQYNRISNYSVKIYSYGLDGVDDSGSSDDIYYSLIWTP
ncbi:MAG: prepilin-type N-terminal cleavage/methylation domain-containing protein [Deltaproteobacteria bacterium]|nr:prepilin-type N-terminal cleavage/methylation domain-containing protein [Deltaproteobacteria bacterium]